MTEDPIQPDSEPPGGPFRSWGGLYLTLILYGVGTILLLYVLTRVLNVGVGP